MSNSIVPSTLQIYDLHPPPTLIDHHHNMICEPYKMPLSAPTNEINIHRQRNKRMWFQFVVKNVCLPIQHLDLGSLAFLSYSTQTNSVKTIKSLALTFHFIPFSLYMAYHAWKFLVAENQDLIAIHKVKHQL